MVHELKQSNSYSGMIKRSLESAVDTPDTNFGPSMVGGNFVKWSNESRPCQFLSWRSGANLRTERRWNQVYHQRSWDGIFIRAKTGITALITLVDPSRSLHVDLGPIFYSYTHPILWRSSWLVQEAITYQQSTHQLVPAMAHHLSSRWMQKQSRFGASVGCVGWWWRGTSSN